MNLFYYKGTRAGMVSYYDSSFVYKYGLNIHPDPDKSSQVCSKGIHLAKSLKSKVIKNAQEVYLARPGVIYGEDDEKIRTGHCWLIAKIDPVTYTPPKNLLCEQEWLEEHLCDHTQEEIENLEMEIAAGEEHFRFNAKTKAKELRTALKTARQSYSKGDK